MVLLVFVEPVFGFTFLGSNLEPEVAKLAAKVRRARPMDVANIWRKAMKEYFGDSDATFESFEF